MMPCARVADPHVCPMVTGVVPHVGGVIGVGLPTVVVGMMPVARVTSVTFCVGPPGIVAKGSGTVLAGMLPVARLADMTAHGGTIVFGLPTVLVGG